MPIIQNRNGTASAWTAANPVLTAGEIGLETDTKLIKIGDGSTAWNSLPYLVGQKIVTTVASSATPTPTGSGERNELYVTAAAANMVVAAPTGTSLNGNTLLMRFKDNGTARTIGWNAIFRAVGVTLPTTTVISKNLYVGARYNSTDSRWDILAVGQE